MRILKKSVNEISRSCSSSAKSLIALNLRHPNNPPASSTAAVADPGGLLVAAQGGDQISLGQLLQHYRNYLWVLASTQIDRRLQQRVSPSDVVQETMLKAHRGFEAFRGRTEPELIAWLKQILANNLGLFVEQHLTAAKRDARREVSLERLGASLDQSTANLGALVPALVNSPSFSAQRREDAVVLADRIANLPADYREVLTLRNLRSLPFQEVAEAMGRTEAAARMLWLRAIERLRASYQTEQG